MTTDFDAIFKAYDVRGTVPDQMDAEMCRGLGAAFARFVGTDKIIVARDMRPDGVEFAAAFDSGEARDATAAGTLSTACTSSS